MVRLVVSNNMVPIRGRIFGCGFILLFSFLLFLSFPPESYSATFALTASNVGRASGYPGCVYIVEASYTGSDFSAFLGTVDMGLRGAPVVDIKTVEFTTKHVRGSYGPNLVAFTLKKRFYVDASNAGQVKVYASVMACPDVCWSVDQRSQTVDMSDASCSIDPEELTENLGKDRDNPNAPVDDCFGSSANFSTGNLYEDYTIPAGLTDLVLSYNSLDSYTGPLGRGWTHTFNTNLSRITGTSLILMEGDGRRVKYTSTDGVIFNPEERFGEESTITKNDDGTLTLRKKDDTLYNFDPDGRLISIADRNGNTTTLNYAGEDLVSITDPYGRTITLTYSTGKIISIQDPLGRTYTLSYTGEYLTSITDPQGGETRYGYDSDGRLVSREDPGGGKTTYTYDEKGRVVSSTDPLGYTKTIEYIEGEERVLITDRNGNTTEYLYDRDLNVIKEKKDPEGNTTLYTYDGRGNLINITHPDGTTESFTYDSNNNLLTYTDQAGNTTTYTYEPDFNQITSITDPLGRKTTFSYDTRGNLIAITDPLNNTTTFEYDSHGKVTGITDPLGNTVTITYDTYGNISTIKDPLGNTTTLQSDILGNLKKLIDANGNPTTYTYDKLNRLTSVTDALLQTTTYTYGTCSSCGNGKGKPTSITDANGNTSYFEYDLKGRLVKETDPLGNTTTYTYDGEGNLISKTDANGNTITYTYDSLNRLIEKNYPDGTKTTFTYDSMGRILTASNKNITYTFTYDNNGRVTRVTDSSGKVITYQYDALGNRTAMTDPQGKTTTYTYDRMNRLIQLTDPSGQSYSFAYDPPGRRTSLSLPNGTYVSYTYDEAGRLTDLIHRLNTGRLIKAYRYGYDRKGNRTSKQEAIKLPNLKKTRKHTTTYIYDELDRLIKAVEKGRVPWQRRGYHGRVEEYSYDPAGNRYVSYREVYNEANQLIKDRKHRYEYDRNGNLIKKTGRRETTTYTYDYENRLTEVVKKRGQKTITVTFAYDPFGRRILKTVLKEGIGRVKIKITYYTYDREDIIMEEDEKGEVTKYIHGPGIDEPLAIERKGKVYYYHSDGLGSITALTDKNGRVVGIYRYDSYGRVRRIGRIRQPYAFTGREYDKETGLYYYRARYYDPEIGRFLSKDPFPGLLTNPQTLNLYPYVGNNPIIRIDPLGFWYIDIGYSGSATGALGPGVTIGVQIGPSGIYGYYGFGLGVGRGISATFNPFGEPSGGVSVTGTVRGGTGIVGAQAGGSFGSKGFSWTWGAGYGIGFGSSITATHTIKIFDWSFIYEWFGGGVPEGERCP